MCDAAKGAQMLNAWTTPTPCLVWCHLLNALRRGSVEEIYGRRYGLAPEASRHALGLQKTARHADDRLVAPLYHAVLLGRVGRRELPSHSLIGEVLAEAVGGEITPS